MVTFYGSDGSSTRNDHGAKASDDADDHCQPKLLGDCLLPVCTVKSLKVLLYSLQSSGECPKKFLTGIEELSKKTLNTYL